MRRPAISHLSTTDFLNILFGDITSGHVDICRTSPPRNGGTVRPLDRHRFYNLAIERAAMLADASSTPNEDVYFAVSAFSGPLRSGDDEGAFCQVVYADVDRITPDAFRVEPSIVVQTSPGHYHCYWVLDRPYRQSEIAAVSMKLPRVHDLDASSGIATKLLRVPGTTNTNYDEPYTVSAEDFGHRYTLADIDFAYAEVEATRALSVVEQTYPEVLPELFDVYGKIPSTRRINELMDWDQDKEPDKRSERRYELCRLLLEAELEPAEVLVAVWSTNLADKYREEGRPMEHLWRFDVLKALGKQVEPGEALEPYTRPVEGLPVGEFVAEDEVAEVFARPGFMEEWEQRNYEILHPLTPNQYIRINGYTYLAGALGDRVAIMPPGVNRAVFCNQYVLNLGPTTSGKSEALFLLKRYLKAASKLFGHELVVGSNATSEGLIKALKTYDRKSALLVTDEVSSKFRQWQNSAQMAHARETELEIYDGYLPKNLRASEGAGNTEDVHLAFTQYMMGVATEVESILDKGFLRSGYLPRCVIVKAERMPFSEDEARNVEQGDEERTQDHDPYPELWANRLKQSIEKNGRRTKYGRTVMKFSDEAWARFLEFRTNLLKFAEAHPDADVVRPMAIRFAVSMQKLMALLAYERVADDVEVIDVLRVLVDAQDFWGWSMDVVQAVSDSQFARMQEDALAFINSKGNKARLSDYHTHFKSLSMRERLDVLDSLKARRIVRETSNQMKTAYLEVME